MRDLSAIAAVEKEYAEAACTFHNFQSRHEGYAIIKEELDELWEAIKTKGVKKSLVEKEATQVAAMALRFLIDLC